MADLRERVRALSPERQSVLFHRLMRRPRPAAAIAFPPPMPDRGEAILPELQDLTDQQVTDALMKLLSEEEDGDSMAGMARGGEAAVEAVGSAAAASIGDTSQLLPLLLEGKA